jgi:hypothetical protein
MCPEVRRDIEDLGGLAVTGPSLDLASLKLIPPAPQYVNFDATSLCALVSELTHTTLPDQSLEVWSHGNIHWRQCYQQVCLCLWYCSGVHKRSHKPGLVSAGHSMRYTLRCRLMRTSTCLVLHLCGADIAWTCECCSACMSRVVTPARLICCHLLFSESERCNMPRDRLDVQAVGFQLGAINSGSKCLRTTFARVYYA